MTFNRARVRQLSIEYSSMMDGGKVDPDWAQLIESAILAAARELLGEPSEEMHTAGYRAFLSLKGGTADLRVWRAMAAARLAQLGEE